VGKAKKSSSAKCSARKTKTSTASKKTLLNHEPKPHVDGSTAVMERRSSDDRRAEEDRRKINMPVAAERRTLERRQKTNRRRQIDPTTCERNYSAEEIEFMTALEGYKRTSGRMFPTCSEILEVLRGLGYERQPKVEPVLDTLPATAVTPSVESVLPLMSPLA